MEFNESLNQKRTVGTQTESPSSKKNSRAKSISPRSKSPITHRRKSFESFAEKANKFLELEPARTEPNLSSSKKNKTSGASPGRKKLKKAKIPAFKNYEDYLRKTFNKSFRVPESDRKTLTDRKTRSAPTTPLKSSSKSLDSFSSLPPTPKKKSTPSKPSPASDKKKEVIVIKYKTIDSFPSSSPSFQLPLSKPQYKEPSQPVLPKIPANLSDHVSRDKPIEPLTDSLKVNLSASNSTVASQSHKEEVVTAPTITKEAILEPTVHKEQSQTDQRVSQSKPLEPETRVEEKHEKVEDEAPHTEQIPRKEPPPPTAIVQEPMEQSNDTKEIPQTAELKPTTPTYQIESQSKLEDLATQKQPTPRTEQPPPQELEPKEGINLREASYVPSKPQNAEVVTTEAVQNPPPATTPKDDTPNPPVTEPETPSTSEAPTTPSLSEEETRQQIRDSISRKLSLSDKRISTSPSSPTVESVKDRLIKKTHSMADLSQSPSLVSASEPLSKGLIQVSEGALEQLRSRLGRRGSLSDLPSHKLQVNVPDKPAEETHTNPAPATPRSDTDSLRIQLAKKLSLSEVTRSSEKKEESSIPAVSETAMQALKARMARKGSVELTKSDSSLISPRGPPDGPGIPPPPPPPLALSAPASPLSIVIPKSMFNMDNSNLIESPGSAPPTPQSRAPFMDPMDELKLKLKSMPLKAENSPERVRSSSVNVTLSSPRHLPPPVVDTPPSPKQTTLPPPPPPDFTGVPPPPPPPPMEAPRLPSSTPSKATSSLNNTPLEPAKPRPPALQVGSLQDELKLKLKDVQHKPNMDEEINKKRESTPRGTTPLPLAELKQKLTQRNQTQALN